MVSRLPVIKIKIIGLVHKNWFKKWFQIDLILKINLKLIQFKIGS